MADTTRKRKPLTPEQREAQYKRSHEWDKNNTVRINFMMMKSTEADLIEWLQAQPNKNGYIKSLIRADMARQEKKEEE